jgi:predicted DNA-binding transcriptional regulator YafY
LDAHATELVHRIRAGDAVAERERAAAVDRARAAVSGWQPGMPIPGITSATTLGLLRGAIRAGQRVSLGYVDADGQPTRHTILPISMAGGTLRGHDPSSRQLEAYALHRITDVNVVSDG